MRGRLIEPLERWLLDWPLPLLAAALLWRLAAGVLLWGGKLSLPGMPLTASGLLALWPPPGLIESLLLALLAAASALTLVRLLAPRDYAALVGLACGLAACALAVNAVPRYGWLFEWPLGRMAGGWYWAVGCGVALALLLHLWLHARWRGQLRGHGIVWTQQWAERHSFAARKLALRALRFMGDWETN